jgi:hypothetical protein
MADALQLLLRQCFQPRMNPDGSLRIVNDAVLGDGVILGICVIDEQEISAYKVGDNVGLINLLGGSVFAHGFRHDSGPNGIWIRDPNNGRMYHHMPN